MYEKYCDDTYKRSLYTKFIVASASKRLSIYLSLYQYLVSRLRLLFSPQSIDNEHPQTP